MAVFCVILRERQPAGKRPGRKILDGQGYDSDERKK